jgi:FlaA1/EpsC-like NDP-sugar epimerase
MGATKRICEMIVQLYSKHSNTNFSAARFGNVLGSNGSVIPLFKQQIKEGGPVTITHEEITRYFMTIPEAVQLVLRAASLSKGGEIFVLDMGEPVKIKDLAYNLIRLSGLIPEEDIKVEYIGLRPGEKLYEELLITNNASQSETGISKIFIEKPIEFDEKQFLEILEKMMVAAKNNEKEKIISLIEKAVPSYKIMSKGQENFYNVPQSYKQGIIK